MKKPDLRLLERDVTKQIVEYLEWHGWRAFRNQVSAVQNAAGGWFSTGEKGMPDYLFVHYQPDDGGRMASTLTLWVELKREGESLRPDQIDWHTYEIKRGAVVLTVDNFEAFRDWYQENFGWLGASQQLLPLNVT